MEVDINQSYIDALAVRIQHWDMLALRLKPNEYVRYTVLKNNLVHKIKSNQVGTHKHKAVEVPTTLIIEEGYETLHTFWQTVELINHK